MSRRHDVALLAALVVVVVAVNLLWLTQDLRPPHWDRARHLMNSLILYDRFALSTEWALLYAYYPPFTYWTTDILYALFQQREVWVASLSQSMFLAVLAFSTYGIGSRVASSRVGVLSAILVLTSPLLVSGFKDYMLDGPLTAMTALSLYLLIRSEGFASRRISVLFGLICGLAVLTKWSFAVAMLLPAAVAAVAVVRLAIRERSWTRVSNLAGAGAIALAVGAPWYLRNLAQLWQDTSRYDSVAAQIEGDPPVLSVQGFLYYGWNLLNDQLFLVPFLFFAAGIALLPRRPGAPRRLAYPLLLVAGSYVLFTAVANKDPRFTLPMLPAVAIVATYWLDDLSARRRGALISGLVAYCALTFVTISFGIPFLPRDVFVTLPPSPLVSELPNFTPAGQIVQVRGVRVWAQLSHPLGPPSRERWYQEEIFRDAARRSGQATLWYQGPSEDLIWFNTWGMAYFSERYSVPWINSLDRASHAAIRTYPARPVTAPPGFLLISEYVQPDGGVLRLYERTPAR